MSSENNVDKRIENGLNSKQEVQRNKYPIPIEDNVRNIKISPVCETDKLLLQMSPANNGKHLFWSLLV